MAETRQRGCLRRSLAAGLAIARAAVAGGRASAAGVKFGNVFTQGGASANWTKAADAPGDTDGHSVALNLPSTGGYAVILLANVPAAAPSTPPSFWFNPS